MSHVLENLSEAMRLADIVTMDYFAITCKLDPFIWQCITFFPAQTPAPFGRNNRPKIILDTVGDIW